MPYFHHKKRCVTWLSSPAGFRYTPPDMNNHNTSPDQTITDLAHLAWCAIVALRFAQRDGQVQSPLMEHTFLLRWLAAAQKQRRFPRTVAPDIDSLLSLGRQKGLVARLYQRLEYLWESCSSSVKQQSDLFRLTYSIEALKAQGWINAVITDGEWNIPTLLAEYGDASALLVKKSDLVHHFTNNGQLTDVVTFLVKGTPDAVTAAFDTQSLRYTITTSGSHTLLTLLPS